MLSVEKISKAFGQAVALDRVTFQVGPGEVFGLLGPNGAGKSTTFNIICNLLLPDSGTVRVDGKSQTEKRTLGVVSQQIALYRNLCCEENLRFFGSIYGLRGQELDQRVALCLRDVQLADRRNSLVRTLSGGMQRRLHVAAGLLHNPKLVILDEPSAGLDLESRQDMWALIRRMQKDAKAVVLTTHLLEEAEALCTRIGILQAGSIVAEGSPEELKSAIPAVEVAILQCDEETRAMKAADARGLTTRRYEHGLAVWLKERTDLRQVLDIFAGVHVDSITRRPVNLEDVYFEIARRSEP